MSTTPCVPVAEIPPLASPQGLSFDVPAAAAPDQALREYWEKDTTVSIIDKNLHQLEMATVCRHLLPSDELADLGCGDGTATVRYARHVARVVGIERSVRLQGLARKTVCAAGVWNVEIRAGDVLNSGLPSGAFDAVVSQRLLINLASWEDQQLALLQMHRILKPGGRLILVENTNDAMQAMNDLRHRVGLPPVPQHWHNRFFDYDDLRSFLEGRFQLLSEYDFGLYYLLTRVYVPMFADFHGYGLAAVKDPVFERSDPAARALHELLGERLKIPGCRALGPIQVFVFRREGE